MTSTLPVIVGTPPPRNGQVSGHERWATIEDQETAAEVGGVTTAITTYRGREVVNVVTLWGTNARAMSLSIVDTLLHDD